MTKEEYQNFSLRYKGCGACFPLYEKLTRFEKMWFAAIQKDVTNLEEENKKLKKRFSHDCPSCVAFGKHCPHKVNGDPYFYDCYLTVKDLEKENAEAKELLKKWQQANICDAVVLFADTEEFLKRG